MLTPECASTAIRMAARLYGLPAGSLFEHDRRRIVGRARQDAMAAMARAGATHEEIARLFNRHVGVVRHGVRLAEDEAALSQRTARSLARIAAAMGVA